MALASIVVPVFKTQATLPDCLRHLAEQSATDFELIVVESGGAGASEVLVEQILPGSTYLGFAHRLSAHEALNEGATRATGDILVFIDPDSYARPSWLESLLRAQDRFGPIVVGAVGCHRCSAIDAAAHLAKFDKWLPGAWPRELAEAPTVNFSIRRELFESMAGFAGGTIHADTDLSWRLRQQGYRIHFAPSAIVDHHHLHTLTSLLAERFDRGRTFAQWQRSKDTQGAAARRWTRAIVSLLPLRLANQTLRLAGNAWRADRTMLYLAVLPLASLALYAWLLGEVAGGLSKADGRKTAPS